MAALLSHIQFSAIRRLDSATRRLDSPSSSGRRSVSRGSAALGSASRDHVAGQRRFDALKEFGAQREKEFPDANFKVEVVKSDLSDIDKVTVHKTYTGIKEPRCHDVPYGTGGASSSAGVDFHVYRLDPRTRNKPLMVRVPGIPAASSGRHEWPLEQERASLISLTAERNLLKQENSLMLKEIAHLRRQAQVELNMHRAELLAQQAEREELQQLAAEAKRLLDLKEKVIVEDASTVTEEQRHQTMMALQGEHVEIKRRARLLCAPGVPPPRTAPGADLEEDEFDCEDEDEQGLEVMLDRLEKMRFGSDLGARTRRPMLSRPVSRV